MRKFLGASALVLTVIAGADSAQAGRRHHHGVHEGHRLHVAYVGNRHRHVARYRRGTLAAQGGSRYFAGESRGRFVDPRERYFAGKPEHYASRTRARYHGGTRIALGGHPRGGRPRAWCGWYARSLVGSDPGPNFNLARNWAHWGRAARPSVGVMVVWRHHVGMITGRTADGQWIIKSGNDGHAVRERPRSIAGAIAFRAS